MTGLRVVEDSMRARGERGARSTAKLLGFGTAALPRWARVLVTEEVTDWIEEHLVDETLTWDRSKDRMPKDNKRIANLTVSLKGLSPRVALEMAVGLALDGADDVTHNLTATRAATYYLRDGAVSTIRDVPLGPTSPLSTLSQCQVRRWVGRIDWADADPEKEWLRDDVRLNVVYGTYTRRGMILRLGEIQQPWLRDMTVDTLRVTARGMSKGRLQSMANAAIQASEALATRRDGGNKPEVLTQATMRTVIGSWRADPTAGDGAVDNWVGSISALVTNATALEIARKYGLSTSFTVPSDLYPETRKPNREDIAFPDATFRFLMGADDNFGRGVLDLAKSVPGTSFTGDLFVTALQLAANFGRRPEELCALNANRLRIADSSRAELLYDNFKSGRERVWLPVDARSAEIAEAWTVRVRGNYPHTALDDLKLLPTSQVNPRGLKPITAIILSGWFRRWTVLLEQAIVLGWLHRATGQPLDDLLRLQAGDLRDSTLILGDQSHWLDTATAQMLIDYLHDVVERTLRSRFAPPRDEVWLFPDPFVRVGGQTRKRAQAIRHTEAHRFDALGEHWLEVACQYIAGGIPGHNLGARRVGAWTLQVSHFRHTYLQHLVNLGTDIFLVAELADHANVQTTIDSYVQVRQEELRQAVEELAKHRLTQFGTPLHRSLPIASASLRDVGTNDCQNPHVLTFGTEGCDRDRHCFDCEHFAADPSNVPDIKAEIQTCNATLARLEASAKTDLRVHHIALLRHRKQGWRKMLATLEEHLASLAPEEREQVENAARVVREFRNRVRVGGLNLGGGFGDGSPTPQGRATDRLS